ncbi:hypothetical protein ILUMI_26562 [Ignelater luminosus]|uniref:Uncharacterized protein n=1 Tax=Ignelater luminosus TaxID=2038154 RepID=A0A8K0C6F3_IGNLU|nr:hypothetical protein ILUMI_26562 [Ignelater luminosus]
MFRYIFRTSSPKIISNFTKRTILNSSKSKRINSRTIRKWNFVVVSGLCGFTRVYAKSENDELVANFEEEIKRATLQGEKYLAQLMRVLRTLILQTSIEYQENLIKQIEITKENTQIGPVGEHWDKLTTFRVKGNELKEELNKYEALASSLSEIVHAEVQTSLAIGNRAVLQQLSVELEKLQKLCNEQLEEIHKYESELLAANRDSILHGVRSK